MHAHRTAESMPRPPALAEMSAPRSFSASLSSLAPCAKPCQIFRMCHRPAHALPADGRLLHM